MFFVQLPIEACPIAERLAETDLLVDAIYGTGFYGELEEKHRDIAAPIYR